MNRIFFGVLVFAFAIFLGCTKNSSGNESILHGTWIKGNNPGDTLQFLHKNGKNIMLYNLSFNAALPVPAEAEYTFLNNKLSIRNYPATSGAFFTLESFIWKRMGEEFDLKGNELYLFMSSTLPTFTYRKI